MYTISLHLISTVLQMWVFLQIVELIMNMSFSTAHIHIYLYIIMNRRQQSTPLHRKEHNRLID